MASPSPVSERFVRFSGVCSVLAGVFALAGLVVGLITVDYDFEVFEDTSRLISLGADAAGAIRWSNLLNMFGNYLFLLPLALLLFGWLRSADEGRTRFYTTSGVLYITLGAAGASILAAGWSHLIEAYAAASAEFQPILVSQIELVNAIAEQGLQGALQNIVGALWFIGMGSFLQSQRSAQGIFGMVVGVALLLNAVGNLFNIEFLSLLGLTGNILLGPIWAIWMGVSLLRKGIA